MDGSRWQACLLAGAATGILAPPPAPRRGAGNGSRTRPVRRRWVAMDPPPPLPGRNRMDDDLRWPRPRSGLATVSILQPSGLG